MVVVMPAPALRRRAGRGWLPLSFLLATGRRSRDGCGAAEAPLQFRITEGRILNAFHQQGPVAAHLLLSARRDVFPVMSIRIGKDYLHCSPVL